VLAFVRSLVDAVTHSRRRPMLSPGDTAPDFTGRDHLGNTVRLADFRGKFVVLWFYPKADTPG
jgi:peroxiredoxin